MAEFNIRTDSVDVEQIMRQIRARIKEKRGVDYTEQQIQELANVKLERFLDPKGVRSDLVEQFKRTRGTTPPPPNYNFEDTTLYESHRGVVRLFRTLMKPFVKLMFNANAITHALHMQSRINTINEKQASVREELDSLYYEVIHNLVLEVTRLGIENKNLKMRVESLNSRIDFDERRARALETVVQYKPGTGPTRESRPSPARPSGDSGRAAAQPYTPPRQQSQPRPYVPPPQPPPAAEAEPEQPTASVQSAQPQPANGDPAADATTATVRRRRRRRRGRRGGRGRGPADAAMAGSPPAGVDAVSSTPPHGDATADAAIGTADHFDEDDSGSDSDSDSGPGSDGDEGPDTGQ